MKRVLNGRGFLIVGGLAALVVAGCATVPAMSPAETVAERQKLMKANGAAWKDVGDKVKAGNIDVAASAQTMADNAKKIAGLFPPGSMTEKSKAKPEIWQKFPEFEAAAKNFAAQSEKLRDAAQSKDKASVEAVVKDFGRLACGSCHTPFRVPPPRQ
jgi:cytochrome c556